jgi:RNA polymerase sigma-70 factor (ECF subfamily)
VNESESIQRILAGDREAYCTLITPYERLVFRTAFSVLRNDSEAEDCTQDTFLKAYQRLDAFRGEGKFSTWLVTIAINEAKMRLRKLRLDRYESLDEATDEDIPYHPRNLEDWRETPSETLERKEIRNALESAVNSLPEIYRQVFVLRDIENMNIAATAEVLGLRDGIVKIRLLRARLQLRQLLSPIVGSGNLFNRRRFKQCNNPIAYALRGEAS